MDEKILRVEIEEALEKVYNKYTKYHSEEFNDKFFENVLFYLEDVYGENIFTDNIKKILKES